MPSSTYQALLQSGKGLSDLDRQEPKFGSVFQAASIGFGEVQSVDIDFSGGYPDLTITRTNGRTLIDGSTNRAETGYSYGFPPEESWYWYDRSIRQDAITEINEDCLSNLNINSCLEAINNPNVPLIASALITVEYDENDPTNYTAWGYWMDSAWSSNAPYLVGLEFGAIAAGPDFEDDAGYVADLTGTAMYQGDFSGGLLYLYSGQTGIAEAEYWASVDLTADFDSDTIDGCIGCRQAMLYGLTQYRAGAVRPSTPVDRETDLRIQLGSAPISSDGKFQSSSVTVQGSGITSSDEGDWAGRFTSKENDVRPQDLIGTVSAGYSDASGAGVIFGGFYANDRTE